jgi:hypothetical protein
MDLKTAGFGPQADLGKVDAPLGHLVVDGKPKAMLDGPNGILLTVMLRFAYSYVTAFILGLN